MRLIDTQVVPSPYSNEFCRLEAEIDVESRGESLHYWFDFPTEVQSSLSDSGNPWAVLMLPLACYFDEPLRIDRPLDRVLHNNLKGLKRVWSSWYPEIHRVAIEAPTITTEDRRQAQIDPSKKTIACFSGGIDSNFTYFRHKDQVLGDGLSTIDDLMCVAGFNTSIDDFEDMRRQLGAIAEKFGNTLVPIRTNMRYGDHGFETPYSIGPWMEHLSHGAFLASLVHMMGGRYKEFIIPGTNDYAHLKNWGSHPLTDPLLAASDLIVSHDGASFTRTERTERVAQSTEALEVLHVCWQDRDIGNCSNCEKCLRTMATLDVLGVKDRAVTFDWSRYSMERLSRVWLRSKVAIGFFLDIAERAEREGRDDVAAATNASVTFSRRKGAVLDVIESNTVLRTAWHTVRPLRDALRSAG